MKQDIFCQICLFAIYFLISFSKTTADRPCAARQIANRSIVCVCNATYCDEITRVIPARGEYVTYTSSAAGSRFKKGRGYFSSTGCSSAARGEYSIELDASKKYQKIKGFGGSVTDSASINWRSLPVAVQEHLINSYFSKSGLEYNLVRVPIGCSDFSVRHYTYDDVPGDVKLDGFSLQVEDYVYKIPMLKKIFKAATAPVLVVGSSWTCPPWMKYRTETNSHCGFLKREYYQTFANYLYKFIESYEKNGVPIWAITTGNEPSLAKWSSFAISCLGWDNYNQGNWIVNNLGPTIRNSKFSKVKILALDDQLYTIKTVLIDMVRNNSKVLDFMDGIAVHYYTDSFVAPKVLTYITKTYPNMFVISTEACEGYKDPNKGVDLGSWKRAKKYVGDVIQYRFIKVFCLKGEDCDKNSFAPLLKQIIEMKRVLTVKTDLNHDEVGWIDWNLCLDLNGGPNVDKNFVDSPIIVDGKKEEFLKQPMFYALGHISKFIPRDSVRIRSWSPPCSCSIAHVAVQTPRNTIVVVFHNTGDATSVTIKQGKQEATISMEADSITTVEYLIQ